MISIRVIPSYELKKSPLSFGDSIKIPSLVSFRDEMKDIYSKVLSKYN
jgi:hypothetical protein